MLESVEGGEHVGRYTFMGVQPYKKMVARGTRITVREGRRGSTFDGDIFAKGKKALGGHTPARLPGPPPFPAGAGGFFRSHSDARVGGSRTVGQRARGSTLRR